MGNANNVPADPAKDLDRVNSMAKFYAGPSEKFVGRALTYAEVFKKINNKNKRQVYLVDVRSANEREISMVDGAISKEEFEARELNSYKEAEIVMYCTIGFKSGNYARMLKSKGMDVYNAQGVVPFSHDEACKFVHGDSKEPTKRIHVYGSYLNLVGPGYEAIMFPLWQQIRTFLGW